MRGQPDKSDAATPAVKSVPIQADELPVIDMSVMIEQAQALANAKTDSYLRGYHNGVNTMLLVVSMAALSVGLYFRMKAAFSESK